MASLKPLSITLPEDLAEMVRTKVASGEYPDESAVIAEGLRAIAEPDAAYEQWLIDEVLPTLEAHDADPSRAIPIEEARREFQAYAEAQQGRIRSGT